MNGDEETGEDSGGPSPLALVKRFSHDVRNHLNGLEMEVCFLDDLMTDPEASEALNRLRQEVERIERAVQSLANRFAPPSRQPVSVIDAFTLWKTRVRRRAPELAIEWGCEATDESIYIDMKMIADVMSEWFDDGPTVPVSASILVVGTRAVYRVRWADGKPRKEGPSPGFETVIARNGGRYEDEGDAHTVACAFPLWTD